MPHGSWPWFQPACNMTLDGCDWHVVCMQVVIVPITKKDTDRASVMAAVDKLHAALKAAGIRVKVGT